MSSDNLAKETTLYGVRMFNEVLKGVISIDEYVKQQHLEKEKEDMLKELIQRFKQKEDLYMIPAKDQAVKDLQKEFRKEGIMYIHQRSTMDDLNFFVIHPKDLERAQESIEKVMARGGQIVEQDFNVMARLNEKNGEDTLFRFQNVSLIEKKALLENARMNGYTISSVEKEDGKFDIYCTRQDKDKVAKTFAKLKSKELGVSGKYFLDKENRDLNIINEIVNEVGTPLRYGETRDFYVFSGDFPAQRIHVTEGGYRHERGDDDGHLRVVRDFNGTGKTLKTQLAKELVTISNPVVLSKQEFELTKMDKNKRKELIQSKMKGIEYDSEYERILAQKERLFLRLVELKMQLDNVEQREGVSDFYNPNVSIQEFVERELENTNYIHEERVKILLEQLDLTHMSAKMKEDLYKYGDKAMKEQKRHSEPEMYYPTPEDLQKPLTEIIREHGDIVRQHQRTREEQERDSYKISDYFER